METVLIILFLTRPLGSNDNNWTLQSSSTAEFNTPAACHDAITSLSNAVSVTKTIKFAAQCYPKGQVGLETQSEKSHGVNPPPTYAEKAHEVPRMMVYPPERKVQ
ncbi:hypothetical protein [Rhizobium rhizogenes]|uniref:hypothetical protein n=1 Tax=Rhizobium rhizogenes TaxID=359 RepID=UPI001572E345|nr:hypothetical protein [Rhizobium rhizogenes]NTG08837.1 hypothetical protein [Rhizobium rhizogenes]